MLLRWSITMPAESRFSSFVVATRFWCIRKNWSRSHGEYSSVLAKQIITKSEQKQNQLMRHILVSSQDWIADHTSQSLTGKWIRTGYDVIHMMVFEMISIPMHEKKNVNIRSIYWYTASSIRFLLPSMWTYVWLSIYILLYDSLNNPFSWFNFAFLFIFQKVLTCLAFRATLEWLCWFKWVNSVHKSRISFANEESLQHRWS